MELPESLGALLASRAHATPHRVAYRYLGPTAGPASLTDGELADAAARLAARLQPEVEEGGRVLLLFGPGLEFIQAFFGCAWRGAVAVPAPAPNPVKPALSLKRLESILESASPKVVLTTRAIAESVAGALGELPSFQRLRWLCVDERSEVAPAPLAAVRPDDFALIQYTSGSTSTPKGAALSHGSILHNLQYFDDDWRHDATSISINWLPAFHDLGLVYGILQGLFSGFLSLQMSPIDVIMKPSLWLKALSESGATHTCGPNFIYELCCKKVSEPELAGFDLSRLRVALTAAEPVRAETMARFAQKFAPAGFHPQAFCPGYGLSEATCKVSALFWEESPLVIELDGRALEAGKVALGGESRLKAVGCGRPGADIQVRIVHPDGRLAAPDEVGEIWVSGPNVASAYYRQPEETEARLKARLPGDSRAYLRTGDLGFLYQDQLFITGRIKDLIIIRGANHYPQDLEYTAQDSSPLIRPGCVAAFAAEGDEGEQVALVAEVAEARALDETIDGIIRSVSVSHGIKVDRVALIKAGTIPKTTSGKIQRSLTRRLLLQGELSVLRERLSPSARRADPRRRSCREQVAQVVSEVASLPLDRLLAGDSLHSLGIDSLGAANVAYDLGVTFQRDLPSDLIDRYDTIDKLVEHLLGGDDD